VTTRVFVLDPGAEAWRRVADLPAPRHHMPLVVAADSLYAMGGYDASGMVPVATVWVFDEAADRWLERAPLPEPRGASAAAQLDGRIVVVGGVGPRERLLDSIAIYDPASGAWSAGAPIPMPRDHLAAAVVDGALYSRRVFAEHEVFDVSAGGWSKAAPLPTARHGLAAAARGGQTFVIAGGPRAGLAQTAVVETFTP
jgi:N-acetylneuraminic acid mutarotase